MEKCQAVLFLIQLGLFAYQIRFQIKTTGSSYQQQIFQHKLDSTQEVFTAFINLHNAVWSKFLGKYGLKKNEAKTEEVLEKEIREVWDGFYKTVLQYTPFLEENILRIASKVDIEMMHLIKALKKREINEDNISEMLKPISELRASLHEEIGNMFHVKELSRESLKQIEYITHSKLQG